VLSLAAVALPAAETAAAPPPPLRAPAERLDSAGGPVAGKGWPQQRVRYAPAPAAVWPEPGSATVDLTGVASPARAASDRGQRAGRLPVWVSRAAGNDALSRMNVRLLDRASVPQAWRDGLVLAVTAADGAPSGTARLSVDYRSFRYAVGGQWASRLRLWQAPACALTTPDAPGCRSVPLHTINDTGTSVASAEVSVGSAGAKGSYVVLAAAESGADGDFGATPLAPSGAWSAGGNSGAFSWQYPLRTPPAVGPAPSLSLGYSSQAVDGRSEATNNQPSWIGEGFDDSPAYVERRYVPCFEDMENGASNTEKTADQCWRSDNARVRFNGSDNELIHEPDKGWHFRTADGSKIEKLGGGDNGDNDGEHWKMTTAEGTQYFFGLNRLPGQTSATNSTLTVPVFGNHANEPCRGANFASSYCTQAWRWNLDYVVDVRGNTMSYWYGKETNKYARNATDTDDTAYDRAGYLSRIDYGTYDRTAAVHGVTERSTTPYAQVIFETGMRCVANCGTEAAPVKESWKDTPWDQECKATASSCPQQYAPTFWTAKRLARILTRVWDTTKTTPGWQDVESWTLTQTFAATADSTHTGMWLDKIDHAGLVDGTTSLPPVTFTAVSKANRVLTAHGTTHNWLRVSDIVTETGARIHVDYSRAQCTESNLPAAHSNTMRCFPVRVPDPLDPDGKRLLTHWWHKYVVDHVAEDDVQLAGGRQAPSKHTWYEYGGAPAWHYDDDDGLIRAERKTWSQWRGYASVKTSVGDDPATRTLTSSTFLRGMHGDRAGSDGGTRTVVVPASLGSETVHDEDQFAGQVREQVIYNGVEAKPVSKTVNVPWRSDPLASRTINGDTVDARFANTKVTYSAAALGRDGGRGWRVARKSSDFDQVHGTLNWTQSDGDMNVSGDEKCTRHSYNRNPAKNMIKNISRTTVTALPCATAPATVDDMISDERYWFDGATSPGTAPVYGAVTRTERLKDWTAAGTVWQTASRTSYQPDGRATSSTDIRGNVTTTAYTPSVGGPVTAVTMTGPAPGWVARQDRNPYWGTPTKIVDINGRVTVEATYDALGRTSKMWRLGWPRAGHENQPSAEFTYTYATNRDRYPFITTRKLNSDGNAVTSYEILDGLLRPRQSQSMSLAGDGTRVVSDALYDQWGRVSVKYGAHVEPGTANGNLWFEPEWSVPTVARTDYDRASRVAAQVLLAGDGIANLVEKWRTTITTEGDLVKTTPPTGGVATTTIADVEGRTVALRHHTTAAGVDGAFQETRYRYNRKGQLITVTDQAGNEWAYRFDALGRQVEAKDPDAGTTAKTYTDADELETTTDARGEKLWLEYDQFGRKTHLRDDSATGALRAEWRYDRLYSGQSGFAGQLTEAIRYEPAGSGNAYKWQVRQFNSRYQATGVNYVIPLIEGDLGNTYAYEYGYASATGAPTSVSYPGGGGLVAEQITTDYHGTTGLPVRADTSLTGAAGTMATTTYTAYGERNGSVYKPPGGTFVQDVVERDEATRRVTRTTVQTETGTGTISDRRYAYDPAGNITSVADTPQVGPADNQCFRYDALARLTSSWTPRNGVPCETDPSVANLGGPAPYWQDWTLDPGGNRLTEVSHAAGGDTTRRYRVPAGGAGVVRPHAMTQLTTTAPAQAAVVNTYAYDAAGNTTCRPGGTAANDCGAGATASNQTLTWNAEGRLATVTVGGQTVQSNIYDADGGRIIRRDAAGTTLYLPGQELRREGSTTTGTRYYQFSGAVGASRRGGSAVTNLTWLYTDHQGTQQTAINAGTQAVTIRRQTPYGTPRGGSTPWVNGKGFVGGDIDPIGLTHVGAREYDTLTGRFISVDPVLDLADPQQMHGYAYANNSPITRSDPTGQLVCGGPDGAQCHGTAPGLGDNCAPYGCGNIAPDPNCIGNDPGKPDGGGCAPRRATPPPPPLLGGGGGTTVQDIIRKYGCDPSNSTCLSMSYSNWDRTKSFDQLPPHHQVEILRLTVCANDPELCEKLRKLETAQGNKLFLALALELTGITDAQACLGGSLSGCAWTAIGLIPYAKFKAIGKLDELGEGIVAGARVCSSFDPDTPVLMADGTRKKIKDIKVGDLVLATDPETGRTAPKKVTATIISAGSKVLADITVHADGSKGATATVTATGTHPFWVPEIGAWVDALDLRAGRWLQTASGTWAQISAIRSRQQAVTVHNLTVADIPTYYVVAGNTPVLVHNTGPCPRTWMDPDRLRHHYMSMNDAGQMHAADFGILGDFNAVNGARFVVAVQGFVRAPGTISIRGTFRGQDAIHYVDPSTGLHASFAANGPNAGMYLGGWRSGTGTDQFAYLMRDGVL
jgi:RHS repeat-associated protein